MKFVTKHKLLTILLVIGVLLFSLILIGYNRYYGRAQTPDMVHYTKWVNGPWGSLPQDETRFPTDYNSRFQDVKLDIELLEDPDPYVESSPKDFEETIRELNGDYKTLNRFDQFFLKFRIQTIYSKYNKQGYNAKLP